jgi:hypothetical protein
MGEDHCRMRTDRQRGETGSHEKNGGGEAESQRSQSTANTVRHPLELTADAIPPPYHNSSRSLIVLGSRHVQIAEIESPGREGMIGTLVQSKGID